MRLGETIQSTWLKSMDIPNGENGGVLDLTIKGASMSTFDDGKQSLDLSFHEHPKVLGCNVTNRKSLLGMFGADIDIMQLTNQRIRLFCVMTQTKAGDPCWGVRLREVTAPGVSVPSQGATPSDVPPTDLNAPAPRFDPQTGQPIQPSGPQSVTPTAPLGPEPPPPIGPDQQAQLDAQFNGEEEAPF